MSMEKYKIYCQILLRVVSDHNTWKNKEAEKFFSSKLKMQDVVNLINYEPNPNDYDYKQHKDEIKSIVISLLVQLYILKKTQNG